jgi:hypothetical protein
MLGLGALDHRRAGVDADSASGLERGEQRPGAAADLEHACPARWQMS